MNKILDLLRNIKLLQIKFNLRNVRNLPVGRLIFWGVALVAAIGLFVFARSFTSCWRLTSLPGIPLSSCSGTAVNPLGTPVVNAQGTPEVSSLPPTPQPAAPEVQYPTWDGGSRINILFVGLRGGDPSQEDCPLCTDTLILLTVDPVTKTAGMLSIPRDMWVNIPGFGYSRINTAWTDGEGSKLPGGGPALTMKTVSQFVGVPVQYYLQVDFGTFSDFIDRIGGIDIYNDEKLVLDPTGGGTDHVKLTCCGMRHLNGRWALAYARCRDIEQGCKDGDVGRAKRQQKVIFAIRDKVFQPDTFASLMAQAPQLYNAFSAGIHTNMSLEDAIKLATLAKDIQKNNIQNGVIDTSMINFANVTLGGQNASVMKPIPDKIRVLRDQIFTATGPTSPLAQGDPTALMQADGARVRVLNGTYTAQLDTRTANYLLQQGVQVTEPGNTQAYNQTTIVLYSPKLYTLRFLINDFGITSSNQIVISPDPSQSVDIEVRLGNDWAGRLPAGY